MVRLYLIISWLLLLATLAAWTAGQLQPRHFASGTAYSRGYLAFQTDFASVEFIHDRAGGAKKLMNPFGSGPFSSGPLDLLKDLHGPQQTHNLLGIRLHHGTLTLPPGRFSPFHETHRFSIAALTIPNTHLLTLVAIPAAFFTYRWIRARRTRSTPGFTMTPGPPQQLPDGKP